MFEVRDLVVMPEMYMLRKAMNLLSYFSIVSLMLRCFLFKKFKKVNESCSLTKAARM